MKIGPAGSRSPADPDQVERIKGWAAEGFSLEEGTPVMVMELRCTEPGCPPIETAVAIMDTPGEPRQYKLHKPIPEVTREDVLGLPGR